MNEPKRACLEPAEFTEFLNDQLTEDEEVAAQKHLVECEKCQAELESLVTCGHGWEELRSSLTDISGSFGRQVDESDVPLDAQANLVHHRAHSLRRRLFGSAPSHET